MRANCSICSDLFEDVNSIIATPCGHVFHEVCCLQWLEHSMTCPACRQRITHKSMVRLYFTMGSEDTSMVEDDSKLRNEFESLKANLKLKDMEKHKLIADMDDLRRAVIKAENIADTNHQKFLECHGEVSAMRLQMKHLVKENSMLQNVADENKRLFNQLNHLKNVQKIVDNCQNDVDSMLSNWSDGSFSSKETATYMTLLKRELQSSREARTKLANELRALKHELGLKTSRLKELEREIQESKTELDFLREAVQAMDSDRNHRTPVSSSKRKFTSPDVTMMEDMDATPFKKPKINMVSAAVSLVHDRPTPLHRQLQNTILVPQASLFRPQNINVNDDSVISEGYNGLGGHTKFVSRSAPVKLKFTSIKPSTSKGKPNKTLDRFLSL